MPYQLIIREEAYLEIIEAYNYYQSKSPGLGERFISELLKRYEEIANHPEHYSFIDEER